MAPIDDVNMFKVTNELYSKTVGKIRVESVRSEKMMQ